MTVLNTKRALLRWGMVLFLLGLLTGFVIPALANPRMGLTSHLEGVLNGIFLLTMGFVWPELRIKPGTARVAFILILYGTYVNWASTLLAAVFGTGTLTPIAAPGLSGAAWQEAIVNFGLVSLAIAIVAGSVMVIWGLRGAADASTAGENH